MNRLFGSSGRPEARNLKPDHVPDAENTNERLLNNTVGLYFNDLGLTWELLAGRRVLDIGAGGAQFAQAARRRGIYVRSIDKQRGGWGGAVPIPPDLQDDYDVCDVAVQGLPYLDSSFDVAVARASLHSMIHDRGSFNGVVDEALRVLRPGGELRFGPNPIHFLQWTFQKDAMLQQLQSPQEADKYRQMLLRKEYDTDGWKQPADVQRARFGSFIIEDAHLIHPDLEVHFIEGEQTQRGVPAVNYYRIQKPGEVVSGDSKP